MIDTADTSHGGACAHAHWHARQDAHALSGHAAALALADESGPRSFFFGVMGTPFQSELSTTLFRMVQSALDADHQVTVWTCGYATNLTQHSLVRPNDSFAAKDAPARNHLTTAQVAAALLHRHRGKLDWYVCRYCMEERGATQQIPEVQVKIPFTFQHYLSAADVSLVLGVK
ncbi:MAG: DsrE family protein [Gammaproteobacteria bacterium]